MATHRLLDATIWLNGLDLQSLSNTVDVAAECEAVDNTVFGQDTRTMTGGLKVVTAKVDYFRDDTVTGATIWDAVGSTGLASFTPTGADGETGFFAQAMTVKNPPWGGTVGDMASGSVEFAGAAGRELIDGAILLPKQTLTGAVNGTAKQLGAVAAGESLYTAIHVFTAGSTADVIVESDDASNFLSAQTRSTTTVTAAGGTWVAPVDGAITDDWWRVRTANVTGTFVIAVLVGIQ